MNASNNQPCNQSYHQTNDKRNETKQISMQKRNEANLKFANREIQRVK